MEEFVETFWAAELMQGYDGAMAYCCKRFGLTKEDAERLLIEDDALNDGNC